MEICKIVKYTLDETYLKNLDSEYICDKVSQRIRADWSEFYTFEYRLLCSLMIFIFGISIVVGFNYVIRQILKRKH